MVLVQYPKRVSLRASWSIILLVTTAALAGCVDETTDGTPADGAPTGTPGGDQDTTRAGVSPPTWSIGDHWTFNPTQGDPATLVVVEDGGADWIIGTDSKDVSFFHAREEISNLGAQRKSDLAGSQGNDRIQYFQWPLTDGANWTTTWDGVERHIVATDNGDGTWSFEAKEGSNTTVRYGYDPAVRWFTGLEFLAPDGSVAFGWTLQEAGRNWTGETYRWHLEEILGFGEPATLSYSTQPTRFQVPEGATDVWAHFQVSCTQGFIVLGIHPVPWDAGAVGKRWNEACTGHWVLEGSLGFAPGEWNADFAWHDTAPGDVSGTLYVRTIEPVQVG